VSFHIVLVFELARQENARALSQPFGTRDAAFKAALFLADQFDIRAIAFDNALRSLLIQSGMRMRTWWPSARPIAAKAIPELPEVASTMRSSG